MATTRTGTYEMAKRCCDALQHHQNQTTDLNHDLAAAISNLCDAIDRDFRAIKADIEDIKRAIRR